MKNVTAIVFGLAILFSGTVRVWAEKVSPDNASDGSSDGTIPSSEIIANNETGIPDKKLYDTVLAQCDSNKDGVLTKAEAAEAKTLDCNGRGINNLQGIQLFSNLTGLDLGGNSISDISPVSSLTNLTNLSLVYNEIKISDISALSSLTKLTSLVLDGNQISDVSALSSFTNLEALSLHNNLVSDFSALLSPSKLEYLYLHEDDTNDIGVLTTKALSAPKAAVKTVAPKTGDTTPVALYAILLAAAAAGGVITYRKRYTGTNK